MSFFPGLGLAYWDMVVLAVRDILDTDPETRGWFSGSTDDPTLDPAGTVDIAPGSTSMAGTGSNWLTTMRPGMKFVVVDQVVEIDTVSSDTVATTKVAHADGAISLNGDEVLRAPRSERVNWTDIILDMAPPYYTVGVGVLPSVDPGIGRQQIDPSVNVTVVFPRREVALQDDESSWYGIANHWLNLLWPKKNTTNKVHRLSVPRFGNSPLVFRNASFGAGNGPVLKDGDGTVMFTPVIELSWQGMDPQAVQQVPQRW